MWDTLFPEALDNATQAISDRKPMPEQPEEPGVFQGFGGALVDSVPYAYNTTASAISGLYDVGKKAADAYGKSSMAPAPELQQDILGEVGRSETAKQFRETAKAYSPDPSTVGLAGRIVHSVASSLVKAGVYSVASGPAAPVLYGADVGVSSGQELMDQGVDAQTALKAGALSATAGGLGLSVAPAFGSTRLKSALFGAIVNVELGVWERSGIRMVLDHADYDSIAAQYKPLDPTQLAIEAITGGAFGAAFHKGKTLTGDQLAAALVTHDAIVRNADTLIAPDNIAGQTMAHDAQVSARTAIESGEPVSVPENLPIDLPELTSRAKEFADKFTEQSKYHPAISSMVDDLVKNEAFRVLGKNGEEVSTTPSVKEIKSALHAYESGSKLTGRQDRILTALSDTAKAEEGFHETMPVDDSPESFDDLLSNTKELTGQDAIDELDKFFGEPKEIDSDVKRAQELLMKNPDLIVNHEGVEVKASDLMAHADDVERTAEAEASVFKAAIDCALRFL
jgi:hypothetical protein